MGSTCGFRKIIALPQRGKGGCGRSIHNYRSQPAKFAIKVAQFNTLVTIRDRVLQKIALAMYVHLSPANNPNLLWFFSMYRELGTIWDLPMQCSDRTCNRCTDSE
jgi:hypothetical protein